MGKDKVFNPAANFDNILLETVPVEGIESVPEPSTWILLLGGSLLWLLS